MRSPSSAEPCNGCNQSNYRIWNGVCLNGATKNEIYPTMSWSGMHPSVNEVYYIYPKCFSNFSYGFAYVSSGNCTHAGYNTITNLARCSFGASLLTWNYIKANKTVGTAQGCVRDITTNQYMFNNLTDSLPCSPTRQCICDEATYEVQWATGTSCENSGTGLTSVLTPFNCQATLAYLNVTGVVSQTSMKPQYCSTKSTAAFFNPSSSIYTCNNATRCTCWKNRTLFG